MPNHEWSALTAPRRYWEIGPRTHFLVSGIVIAAMVAA